MHSIRPVVKRETIQSLSQRTVTPWLRDALMDWAVIAGAVWISYTLPNPLTWFLSVLVIGNRQHALAILGHDGTHFTLSNNRRLNDFLTNLLAMWPIGLTVSGYRILHFKHHQSVGTDNDPELGHKHARSPQWDLPAKPLTILTHAARDLIGGSVSDYKIIVTYSKPASNSDYAPLAVWHLVAIAMLLATGLWGALLLWYGALVTTFMMFFRLRLWLEHQGIADTHRLHLNFWQGALLAPHKSWMHWEHHTWMSIPYHRLGAIRKLTPEKPILTLGQLLEWFATHDYLPSGSIPVEFQHQPVSEPMRKAA